MAEKKSLIIGAMTDYTFDKVAPWVKSINDCGFDGDRAMIVFNVSGETVDKLQEHGFGVIAFNKDQQTGNFTYNFQRPVHVERFFHIYNVLNDLGHNYEYVITTDVKDVIFQYDPVQWLKKNLGDKKLVAGSESMLYKDEPWGNQNLMETFGPFFHNRFKDNIIYNVGTLGGTSEYMKDLAFNIFQYSLHRPIPITDQSTFNVMIQTQPYKDSVFFARQADGWACQAGTTVDPSKIDQFRPLLQEQEPYFKDGYVYTSFDEKFCIVHQYDRVPEWKEVIEARYK